MNHSKKAFEKAKAESNKIEDEDDKKEFDELNKAIEEKIKNTMLSLKAIKMSSTKKKICSVILKKIQVHKRKSTNVLKRYLMFKKICRKK